MVKCERFHKNIFTKPVFQAYENPLFMDLKIEEAENLFKIFCARFEKNKMVIQSCVKVKSNCDRVFHYVKKNHEFLN